jgi:hypothetical protein
MQIASDGAAADANGQAVQPFVLQIAASRADGALTGDITPDYLNKLASFQTAINEPIDPTVLSNGLQYLENEAEGAAQPSTSNTAST